ncbi:hemerythrin domain-containing protein [Actinacidiphila glaucinigra]|uniref:Hemerythrin HHE cation binding domain-containing protein n=1 Tax=Actinacidiphila glaucinigra TaxID=235986 RepID=A0A239MY63_9ACTN|nr:hemerythrin domain-containing protein [Actinacidiphila glaucinigra]SNT47575.1 Hemerythrin HHE cation binding domain-containing protein [Actinacidiphila glaucinigra]
MNPAADRPMADVRDVPVLHTVLDRELGLLPQAVRGVRPGDVRRVAVVADHVALVCSLLQRHHRGQDLLLWPLLTARAGHAAAAVVPVMREQHRAIEGARSEVVRNLADWRSTARSGDELAAAIERLTLWAVRHHALEEKEVLPLGARHVTAAEWAGLAGYTFTGHDTKTLALLSGMLAYEAGPRAARRPLTGAPRSVRLLIPFIRRGAYASRTRSIHGTAHPSLPGG